MKMALGAAASVLAALAIAYYLTYEPAPAIGVTWRAGLSEARRADLERRFLLVNRTPAGDGFKYDLLDTRTATLQALVDESDIADTDGISRVHSRLPPDISYGQSWMWVRYRIPVLRAAGVVEAIVVACVCVLALGVRRMIASRRRRTTVANAAPGAL